MKFSAAAVFMVASTPPACQAFVAPRAPAFARTVAPLAKHEDAVSLALQRRAPAISALFARTEGDHNSDFVARAVQQDYLAELSNSVFAPSTAHSLQQNREQERVAAIETRSNAAAYLGQYEGQSGAAAVYSKLVEHGVSVVNGFSGGAVLPLLDQFHPDNPRHGGQTPIRWITNSNESSAGHIAEGYAKSVPVDPDNLPVGVAIATSGPGVTNLITPLQDAICDGVPMVVLCGQAATVAPKDAFQSSPAVDLTRPCTKWSYQIKSAAEVPMVMDYAFYIARHGRPGPVFIDLPKDLQNQIITPELIDSFVETNLNPPPQQQTSPRGADSNSFVRLVKRYRADGSPFQAVQLGTESRGLPFEISPYVNPLSGTSSYKLRPVRQADPLDLYHADHHPTNLIYQQTTTGDSGKLGNKIVKEGVLQVGGSLTDELLSTILRAKKPVIIAGQGCNDCPDELKEFAERLQIPVTTTLHGLGCFDERSPLALNMMGMHGHATPNFMVQESDLIICIGSRFDDRITGRMSDFAREAKTAQREGRGGIIHVDVRLTENAKQVEPTYFVHTSGKNFLRTLNDALSQQLLQQQQLGGTGSLRPVTGPWLARMKEWQRDYPIRIPTFPTKAATVRDDDDGTREREVTFTPMSAQRVVDELNRQLVEAGKIDDAIFTTGVGVHQMIAAQFITWTQPRQMLSSGSLGTMGVSLGYAIGAKLANPGKIVVSVDGDGSFNMTFTELKTLVEQGIPIKILILDNDGQMMVEYWQRLFHDNRLLAVRNSHNPDYVKLAGAFGIKALYADHEEELEAKMNEFLYADPDQPVLFHVRVKRTPCLPMVAPGQPLQDMILEDMAVDTEGMVAPS